MVHFLYVCGLSVHISATFSVHWMRKVSRLSNYCASLKFPLRSWRFRSVDNVDIEIRVHVRHVHDVLPMGDTCIYMYMHVVFKTIFLTMIEATSTVSFSSCADVHKESPL